jgi:putative transposase
MIRETAVEIAERFPIARAALGTDQKHIPRRCRRAHPEVAPGRSGQIFKRITAREIFRRKPAGKQLLWGGECWTDGYDVATGGERANGEIVERSVQRPGQPQEDLRPLRMCECCDTPQLAARSFISPALSIGATGEPLPMMCASPRGNTTMSPAVSGTGRLSPATRA